MISVCIITTNRSRQLEELLRGLAAQQDAPGFEVLICSNGGPDVTDEVRRILPEARVWRISRANLGAARNTLIENARGHLLLFLDDDVKIDRHLLRVLDDLSRAHPEAMVFGGPNVTPAGSSYFQKVQGAVLASLVGTGPVRRRYGRHPAGPADERYFTLCNLAVRTHAMTLFDARLGGGEENDVLLKLSRLGMQMHYDPRLVVSHERRAGYKDFVRQMYKYGRGRGQILARWPRSVTPAFVAPSVLCLYLLTLPLTAAVSAWCMLPLGMYGLVVVAGAVKVSLSAGRLSPIPLALLLIVSVHLSYGAGVWVGLARPSRGARSRRAGPGAEELHTGPART